MFKLSNYFIKQEEAEAQASAGGETAETDVNTETDGAQDNTETQEDEGDIKNTDETETTEECGESDEGESDGVPESYDFAVPEGMELDQDLAGKFSDVAKELGLNNDQANKVVGLYADQIQGMQSLQQEAWTKQVSDWEGELKSDPDFGGAKFNENAEIAKIAVNKFGGDELKTALNETGLGNHPAVVKFMHKVGLAISEDTFETNEVNNQGREATAQGLYKNSQMNP